jgi:hypothetical protein
MKAIASVADSNDFAIARKHGNSENECAIVLNANVCDYGIDLQNSRNVLRLVR